MPFFEKMKQQKLLSISLLLFTLSLGIVIGTVVNTGVKAEKQTAAIAPDAAPLASPRPGEHGPPRCNSPPRYRSNGHRASADDRPS